MADPVNESLEVLTGVTNKVNPVLSKIVIAVLILLIGLIIGRRKSLMKEMLFR